MSPSRTTSSACVPPSSASSVSNARATSASNELTPRVCRAATFAGMRPSVHDVAGAALADADLNAKSSAVDGLLRAWDAGELDCRPPDRPLVPVDAPGRPAAPELVAPRQLRARRLGSAAGRV